MSRHNSKNMKFSVIYITDLTTNKNLKS